MASDVPWEILEHLPSRKEEKYFILGQTKGSMGKL
jgi:hypothetical protein